MHGTWNAHWCGQKDRPFNPQWVPGAAPGASSGPTVLLRKVLVVDDERDLADITAALLNAHGLDVLVAYSAQEALRILHDHDDIDAVFSDVVMPGMTGLELANIVRDLYPMVKVVLASGYALPALLSDCERAYAYTSKPYTIATVFKLLNS